MGRRRRKGKGAWGNYTITAKKKKKNAGVKEKEMRKAFPNSMFPEKKMLEILDFSIVFAKQNTDNP